MMFRPSKSFFSTSCKDFLSEIDSWIILTKILTSLDQMEGMKDVKSDGSVGNETEKEVVFINLPLMITMLLDLSALKVRPVYFKARVNEKSKVLAPQIVKDIIFRSSMKALLVVKTYYLDETVVWWLPKSILELYSYPLERGL